MTALYLLDTNIFIAALKAHPEVQQRLESLPLVDNLVATPTFGMAVTPRQPSRTFPRPPGSGCLGHATQHVLQDAAVLEVGYLVDRIDPADHRHGIELAVGAMDY